MCEDAKAKQNKTLLCPDNAIKPEQGKGNGNPRDRKHFLLFWGSKEAADLPGFESLTKVSMQACTHTRTHTRTQGRGYSAIIFYDCVIHIIITMVCDVHTIDGTYTTYTTYNTASAEVRGKLLGVSSFLPYGSQIQVVRFDSKWPYPLCCLKV